MCSTSTLLSVSVTWSVKTLPLTLSQLLLYDLQIMSTYLSSNFNGSTIMLHGQCINTVLSLSLVASTDLATGQASLAQRNKHVLRLVTRHLFECVRQQLLQP